MSDDYPANWKDRFLAALSVVPVVSYAAKAAGISRRNAYHARDSDPTFAQAWLDAVEDGDDNAEREAFRRGVQGFAEPVIFQGQMQPVHERDKDGNLVMVEVDTGKRDASGNPIKAKVAKQQIDADGRPVWLTVNRHSDALLITILKGRRKKIYADRSELTGADGAPLDAAASDMERAARLARLMRLAREREAAEEIG